MVQINKNNNKNNNKKREINKKKYNKKRETFRARLSEPRARNIISKALSTHQVPTLFNLLL